MTVMSVVLKFYHKYINFLVYGHSCGEDFDFWVGGFDGECCRVSYGEAFLFFSGKDICCYLL